MNISLGFWRGASQCENDYVKIYNETDNTFFYPEEIATQLFMSFKHKSEIYLSKKFDDTTIYIKDAVISVPAYFNKNFTTLIAAVVNADTDILSLLLSDGPGGNGLTLFAPTNDAFNKLPAGTVETLLKAENKDKLTSVLTYHVVAGKFEAAAVIEAINSNNGKFEVTTVQGGKITLSLENEKVVLTDANGGKAIVVIADVAASNGVIHAIDTVVMPK